MLEHFGTPERTESHGSSVRRKAALAAGLVILALTGCGADTSTPHDRFPAVIAEGKIFPRGGEVVFTSSGNAIYRPDTDTPGQPDITEITAMCMPNDDLYAFINTDEGSTTYTAPIPRFKPCEDSKLTKEELAQVQTAG